MKAYTWYLVLNKPSWAPPSWVFGPVWSFLYFLIAISFGKVIYMWIKDQISFYVVLPFLLNLLFNFIFTPIQFGLRNNILAGIDILLVLGTLVWAMIVIYPYARWVAYFQYPYLLWVCFATVLQITITVVNW